MPILSGQRIRTEADVMFWSTFRDCLEQCVASVENDDGKKKKKDKDKDEVLRAAVIKAFDDIIVNIERYMKL